MSFSRPYPALADRVGDVFALGAGEQMVWVHADRIVAGVTHRQPRWYRTLEEHKGHAVGKESVPMLTANMDPTVSMLAQIARPRPAGTSPTLRDQAPKAGLVDL
jgi:hypothetical protein